MSAVRAREDQSAEHDDVSCGNSWHDVGGSDATTTRPGPGIRTKKRAITRRARRWRTSGTESRKHGRSSGKLGRSRERCGKTLCRTNPWKVGKSQQHKRHVSVPASKAADLIVIQSDVFRVFKILFNGLITNDKFCMSRTARLQLSYWRLPRSARQTSRAGVESPVTGNTEEYLPQQEAYEETTMERSASLRGTA
jgi:hypothetical protein